jgi:hypothetical protein
MIKTQQNIIQPHREIVTDIGTVQINKNGILIMRYTPYLDFTLEKAKSAIEVCEQLTNGCKMLVLVVTGEFGEMSTEVRDYLSGKDVAKHRKAVALVISDLSHRLMAQLIINMRKNYYPTKVFRNEITAEKWLRTLQ